MVEKNDIPLEKFFPDTDDMSTQNTVNLSREKNYEPNKTMAQKGAEITDGSMKVESNYQKEEITDRRNIPKKNDIKEENTEERKNESETGVKSSEIEQYKEDKMKKNEDKSDRKQKQSPKKNISAKRKKGTREEIPDNNTFGKLRTMKANRTVKTNEDSTHTSDGEEDEDSKHTMKVKWSFPNKQAGSSSKKEKKVEYKNFSIVKMGCNKCTEVFYSEGGYNDHLYRKHKIKNVSKYPATILNTIWQHIPPLPKPKESKGMKYLCPVLWKHMQISVIN